MEDYTRDIMKDLAIAHFGFEDETTIKIFRIDEEEKDNAIAIEKMVKAFGEGMERRDEEDN